jgi:hypothetical protein
MTRALISAHPRGLGHTHVPSLAQHICVAPLSRLGPKCLVELSVAHLPSFLLQKRGVWCGASPFHVHTHGELDPVAKGLLQTFGYMYTLECMETFEQRCTLAACN